MAHIFETNSINVAKLAAGGVINESCRSQYQKDGFLGAESILRQPLLQSVIDDVTGLFARPVQDTVLLDTPIIWCWRHQPGGKQSIFPLSESKAIERLVLNGALHDMCRFLAGTDYLQLFECVVFDKPAGIGEQFVWHNDQSYYPTDPGCSISVWIALDRCDEENGAISFAKASHRHGEVASVDVKTGKPMVAGGTGDMPDPVAAGYQTEMVVMEPGDGVFFDARVWHASPPNRSLTRQRRGISIRFWTEPMRYAPGPGKRALFMRQIQVAPGEVIDDPCFPIFRY